MEHKVFEHLMLDLETMGNESSSAIISIAAVEFNINTGETDREFFTCVDLQDCLNIGLKVNAFTIFWWMQQDDKAREHFLKKQSNVSIGEALVAFNKFFIFDYTVWGKGPRFDCGILKDAYDKIGLKSPWDFRKERCVRTLEALRPDIKEQVVFKGTPHNPIDDCKHQIEYCSKIWNSLK